MQNVRVKKQPVTVHGKKVPVDHVVAKGAFQHLSQLRSLIEVGRLEETNDPVGAPPKPAEKK